MKTDSRADSLSAPKGRVMHQLDALVEAVHRSWLGLVLALVATAALWLVGGAFLRAAGANEFWAMVVAGLVVSGIAMWAVRPYALGCGHSTPLWMALAFVSPWFPFALPLGFVAVQMDLARHLRNFGVPYRVWRLDEAQVAQARSRIKA